MARLPDTEIARELAGLPGWTVDDGSICRTFAFASFPDAVAFVNRLVPGAEAADHHPDIEIHYRHVTLRWTTHSEGGLTRKDIEGARASEALAARG